MMREQVRERVEIAALWVVGSCARGALTCGDLEIVIHQTHTGARVDGSEHEIPFKEPDASIIVSALQSIQIAGSE